MSGCSFYVIRMDVDRKETQEILYFRAQMHVNGFETEHEESGGTRMNHTGALCSCCVLLTAELNNSIPAGW